MGRASVRLILLAVAATLIAWGPTVHAQPTPSPSPSASPDASRAASTALSDATKKACDAKQTAAKECAATEATASDTVKAECSSRKAAASECATAMAEARVEKAVAETKAMVEKKVAEAQKDFPDVYGRHRNKWYRKDTCQSILVDDAIDNIGPLENPKRSSSANGAPGAPGSPSSSPSPRRSRKMQRAPGLDDPRWTNAATPGRKTMSTKSWCDDSLTVCWDPCKVLGGGVRFIAERFGTVFSAGQDRPEQEAFGSLALVGLEMNLVGISPCSWKW